MEHNLIDEEVIYEDLITLEDFEDKEMAGLDTDRENSHYLVTRERALMIIKNTSPILSDLILSNKEYFLEKIPQRIGVWTNGGEDNTVTRTTFDKELYQKYPEIAEILEKIIDVCQVRHKEIADEMDLNSKSA